MRMRIAVAGVTLMAGIGCDSTLVQWDEAISAPGDTLGVLTTAPPGSPAFARPARPASLPSDSRLCAQSVVTAVDGGQWYAAWLRQRLDGSVAVMAARSADSGKTWLSPAVVDSVDRARVGCSRPDPSIAASGGYVHVAYSLEAPEGFGVFFAHSMDSSATFHSAVPVIYGDRLSATAVAADGMEVAVGYEDPSGTGHRVDVALSRTQGHTFQPRQRGSPDEMSAIQPEIALRAGAVVLSFVEAIGRGRILRVGHTH